jgi:hypothetical protein
MSSYLWNISRKASTAGVGHLSSASLRVILTKVREGHPVKDVQACLIPCYPADHAVPPR